MFDSPLTKKTSRAVACVKHFSANPTNPSVQEIKAKKDDFEEDTQVDDEGNLTGFGYNVVTADGQVCSNQRYIE